MASKKEIEHVWNKGKTIKGKNPEKYRKDEYGNLIYKSSYGKNSPMGWEIDHTRPKSKGGSESLKNKKPLQTKENRTKSNKYPYKKS